MELSNKAAPRHTYLGAMYLDSHERTRIKDEVRYEVEQDIRNETGTVEIGSFKFVFITGAVLGLLILFLGIEVFGFRDDIVTVVALTVFFYMISTFIYSRLFSWWLPARWQRSRVVVRLVLVPLSGAITIGGVLLISYYLFELWLKNHGFA